MSGYALGYSPSELERLRQQSARLETLTRRFLGDAGVRPGMSVLELGSGLGDVTRLIAEIVGPNGRIVSVERSPVMLEQARALGIANAEFVMSELDSLHLDAGCSFDAVVGRLILSHVAEPATVLRRAVEYVHPGGLVAFQESDSTLSDHLLSLHRDKLPLTYRMFEWIQMARDGISINTAMGPDLYHVFRQAGLAAPSIYVVTEVYGGVSSSRIQGTVTIVRNLLPRLEQLGISAHDIGLETLEQRLTEEIEAADVVQAFTSIASAWATKPG
jgi:ubiquinone/menaquinone biosynthesis C-methylase UbiE